MKKTMFANSIFIGLFTVTLTAPAALAAGPPEGKGPGGGEETAGNNLSFPVIAMDNFSIGDTATSFTVPYLSADDQDDIDKYDEDLTIEEIAYLIKNSPWYPQQTLGNSWQAEFDDSQDAISVTFIDWGDNIESLDPRVRRPFRLEVTLYKDVDDPVTGNVVETMSAYTMAVLENPSSSDELQGTNATTYDSRYASIVSTEPGLVIQYLGDDQPTTCTMTWSEDKWTGDCVQQRIEVAFGPELNVGGKYIYGASQRGWKPVLAGWYRITFYIPSTSGIDLSGAAIANYSDIIANPSNGIASEAEEGTGAQPHVDTVNNLTYVDVHVVAGGGAGGEKPNK